jgi:hypothetical protein
MNWDAVGAVGEVIGALAVVFTLIYLAIQMKQNTLAVNQSAQQSMVAETGSAMDSIFGNPQGAEIWVNGMESWSSLTKSEKAQFAGIMHHTMRVYEQAYLSFRAGILETQIWLGMETAVLEVISSPGAQEWWSLRKHWYSEAFRSLIDNSNVVSAKYLDTLLDTG